jgi:hypothetical protein
MDIVQNCDSYINIPSPQTYRSYLFIVYLALLLVNLTNTMVNNKENG